MDTALKVEPSILQYSPLLTRVLDRIGPSGAQLIADELAGVMEAVRRGERRPIGNVSRWLETLRNRYTEGSFEEGFGESVRVRRANRLRLEAHHASHHSEVRLPSLTRDDALAAMKAVVGNRLGTRDG